jgi:thiamine monophosphate kinase
LEHWTSLQHRCLPWDTATMIGELGENQPLPRNRTGRMVFHSGRIGKAAMHKIDGS